MRVKIVLHNANNSAIAVIHTFKLLNLIFPYLS